MPTAAPLLAGDGSSAGGAQQQVLMLARELARRGHAVGVVAFDDSGSLPERVDGVDVIALRRPATRLPVIRTLAFYVRVFATLRANPASVIVQRTADIHTALAALAARALRSRFVFSSAGLHDFDFGTWERRRTIVWLYGLGVRLAHQVVVQTPEQVPLCRKRFGREPVLIASIAEPAEAQSAEPDVFLWIGRLTAHKRPLEYVELARALPDARFLMIAVDDPSPEGRELAAQLRDAAKSLPNLELPAPRPRDELLPLYERAVAIVSTSVSEGMPNVFLEGWSRGVPALALAHDPDGVIERERLGGFADGSAARMAELARSIWQERTERAELAARCRRYVAENHALAPIADRWSETLGLACAG